MNLNEWSTGQDANTDQVCAELLSTNSVFSGSVTLESSRYRVMASRMRCAIADDVNKVGQPVDLLLSIQLRDATDVTQALMNANGLASAIGSRPPDRT